ncbi:MAG: hypothetical protein QOI10_3795 [Solirubrobacterales bacterium]|jgi:hypothetical protein|nr:hypothetical protein [Solirubrobacterales bacterium]
MALFRRGGKSPSSDGAPGFAREVLTRRKPKGELRRTAICGDRAEAWATVVPGDGAVELWTQLLEAATPGWWPIIVGGEEDERRLAESVTFCPSPVEAVLATAAGLDTASLLERWRRDNEPLDEEEALEWDVVGEWPETSTPNTEFVLPFDILTKQPRPTVVAVIAVADHSEVPAALGWGAWNECPAPEEHVAVLRRWSGLYEAQLVGISGDVVEMRVGRPPSNRDAAMALAQEQYAYCPDIVLQGTESISTLGATLLGATTWYFWWD